MLLMLHNVTSFVTTVLTSWVNILQFVQLSVRGENSDVILLRDKEGICPNSIRVLSRLEQI
jgi:hypothetical protein